MTDDLITRLRDPRMTIHGQAGMVTEAADEIERLRAENAKLRAALSNLHAMVWGECPSLLNEDSGGDAQLAIKIKEALGDD